MTVEDGGQKLVPETINAWRPMAARGVKRSARLDSGMRGPGMDMVGPLHQRLDIVSHLWTLMNFCSVCRSTFIVLVLVVHWIQLVQDLLCCGLVQFVLHHGARVESWVLSCITAFWAWDKACRCPESLPAATPCLDVSETNPLVQLNHFESRYCGRMTAGSSTFQSHGVCRTGVQPHLSYGPKGQLLAAALPDEQSPFE